MSKLGYPSLFPHARGRTAGGTRKRGPGADCTGLFRWTGVPRVWGIAWDRTHRLCPQLEGGIVCVERNRHLCPLAVLCFWIGLLASLPLGLHVSVTPVLLGLLVSVTLASGSCRLSRLLSVRPGRGPCWIGRNAGLGWPLPMLSRNRRQKPRPGVLVSLLFARPRAPSRKCMSKRSLCPC